MSDPFVKMSPGLPAAEGLQRPAAASSFLAQIGDQLAATEELLRRQLDSDVPIIADASEYLFDGGGKRMRPALLLLVSRLLGHDGDEEITYAAVVELIHTATLVHDDIIDQSDLRRGQPTVNRVWGSSKTVLIGDWLYTTAMKLALQHGRVEVISRLCEATLKMTEGELLALERLGAADVSAEEYFDVIDRKTANLFAAASAIPSLISPLDERRQDALETYGGALGMCFQLVDDMLDFTASETDLGKPVLSDLKGGKLTLPLILALPRLGAAERRDVERVLEDRSFERVEPDTILAHVEAAGTLTEVRKVAERYAADALEALASFPLSDARRALEFAPEFVLERRS